MPWDLSPFLATRYVVPVVGLEVCSGGFPVVSMAESDQGRPLLSTQSPGL